MDGRDFHGVSSRLLTPQPVEALVDDLRRLGVRAGDVLMLHASMRAIGQVEGRAEGVVRALDTAVGADGTLMMNLGAREDEGIPFDYLRTPADPDNGVLAEVFRQMRGTLVNDHPDARFGTRGRLAQKLLADVPWHDYYGPGSPLERFVEANGKVLRLGADLGTVTLLHYAEYLAPVADKRRVRREHLVLGSGGPEVCIVECLDDSDGIVDYPGEDYFAVLLREYLATGAAARGHVGHARSELMDARHLVAFATAWMGQHLFQNIDDGL
jgi:aminoglycoside N3'-acetyltransferase